MAQSTVSRQVSALERHLGRRLFVRQARTVELTAQGAAFMPEAENVLEAVERALTAARAAQATPRVGVTNSEGSRR